MLPVRTIVKASLSGWTTFFMGGPQLGELETPCCIL